MDITKKLNSIEIKVNNNLVLSDEDLFLLIVAQYDNYGGGLILSSTINNLDLLI